ncbi:MAG: hypothetical protein ACU85V_15315 [Gammaproteobacteria bacterium]
MSKQRREWMGLSAGERLAGLVVLTGFALAAGALVLALVLGPGDAVAAVFIGGLGVMSCGVLGGLFVLRGVPALARAAPVVGLGAVIVVLSFVLEALAGIDTGSLRFYGSTVFILGAGWALWGLGDRS